MSDLYTGEGLVVAVCMSPEHGFPTYPQERVFIGELGIPGDAHSGPMRESFHNPGTFKPNDRPISIVSDEARVAMNELLGLDMQPGDFNEQLLVQGMGDLGQVAIGATVAISSGVKLEVVDRAWPCEKFAEHNGNRDLIPALDIEIDGQRYSRRGLLTKVVQTGFVQPGDKVTLEI